MGLASPSGRATRFSGLQTANIDATALAEGYFVVGIQAAAATLFGDAVYIDANGEAAKATTNANYLNFLGFAVGGANFNNNVLFGAANIGIEVAGADEFLLVAIPGSICYGIVGGATTTRGARVTADGATAGRVRAQATSSTAWTIATALETNAVAGTAVLLYVQPATSVTLA